MMKGVRRDLVEMFVLHNIFYTYLLEKPRGVLTDLHEPHDDVVEVDVTQRCMVLTLPPNLVQQQVPTVDR